MPRRPTVRPLGAAEMAEAAELLAREHVAARRRRPDLPVDYVDPRHCHLALTRLASAGHAFVAHDDGACVGLVGGRTFEAGAVAVGFVPAEGIAIDPGAQDPTAIAVALFAHILPALLADGARRFSVDHVDLDGPAVALNDLGFGRGVVFATRPVRTSPATPPATDVEIRIATPDDLDTIARLSHVELAHRSTPPIYSAPPLGSPSDPASLTALRAHHGRLLEDGAVHLLARKEGTDVGLLTLEHGAPAPRLCPAGQPHIGPTATDPSVRGEGVGRAVVDAAHDWARRNGYRNLSVDFEPSNPISRPFWLGLGFRPTGYRLRRTIGEPKQR